MILSDKYGFIDPDFVIPENYDVTFGDPTSRPIDLGALREQVERLGLTSYSVVVVLGSYTYEDRAREAFEGANVTLIAPTAGLRQGEAMGKVRRAIDENRPFAPE